MKVARLVVMLCAWGACDPAAGPFRPKPPQAANKPRCGNLPVLAAGSSVELPIVDFDLDRDRESDYIVTRAETCDAEGNCDRDLYVVRESCAVAVGTIRAHTIKDTWGLVAIEHVAIDGTKVERETHWDMDIADYRFKPRGEPRCKAVGSTRDYACADGPPQEAEPIDDGSGNGSAGGSDAR